MPAEHRKDGKEMKATKTNLYKSPVGVEFNRYDFKERTQVKVQNRDGWTHKVYKMYNIPFYEHQYMSWANLDCCGGWWCDENVILKNIKTEKKLAGTYSLITDKDGLNEELEAINRRMGFTDDFVTEALMFEPWETYDHRWLFCVGFARNGRLSDYYDFQEIRQAYGRQGINFTARESVSIQKMMDMEIADLMFRNPNGYDPINPRGDDECVITGMLFGYPVESTASFIMGF